jgi:hypothetical protein
MFIKSSLLGEGCKVEKAKDSTQVKSTINSRN